MFRFGVVVAMAVAMLACMAGISYACDQYEFRRLERSYGCPDRSEFRSQSYCERGSGELRRLEQEYSSELRRLERLEYESARAALEDGYECNCAPAPASFRGGGYSYYRSEEFRGAPSYYHAAEFRGHEDHRRPLRRVRDRQIQRREQRRQDLHQNRQERLQHH